MKIKLTYLTAIALFVVLGQTQSVAQSSDFTVSVNKPKADIQSTMWGIFFEDINFAADGGIYAELVKNRSFEFSLPLMGWKQHKMDRFSLNLESGNITIVNRGIDHSSNQHFARVTVNSDNEFKITNEGFRGIGIKKDNQYNFSIWASQQEGSNTTINVELQDTKGNIIGQATLTPSGKVWKKYSVTLKATDTQAKALLNVKFIGKGVIDVDMISLFPQDTWKQRPGGLRADLIQLLSDLKPGFIRFPGGCIVEGFHLSERYQWKKTVGPIEERELIKNRWNDEFKHRPAPDYFQSFGVGFYEYFQLAEDIGAAPLPILSCGLACQFNSAEVVPLDQLDPYVQDALDLIEFANGASTTKWGKVRTDMGHPASFNLKFIGVGNEQWGPQYIERYKIFVNAIQSKYPEIKIVSGTGPFPDGELFDYAAKELKTLKADIVDEHYYKSPQWFFDNVGRYNKYDRTGPKIFAGEYAAHSASTGSQENKNTWLCALSEAAFMTGLERNADVVTMASYAPLFAHAESWQWAPDLIWFDNLNSYGTPSYYVQKLFSINKGTQVLPILDKGQAIEGQNKLYASAALDKVTGDVIIKIVNNNEEISTTNIALDGEAKYDGTIKQTVLKSADQNAVNGFESPRNISPVENTITFKGKKLNLSLAPKSLTILRIKMK